MTADFKALKVGLLVAVAASALGATTASANPVGGHFTHDAPGGLAAIKGSEGSPHTTQLIAFTTSVTCGEAEYNATMTQATETALTISPNYGNCTTAVGSEATVAMNGCDFLFTVRKENASTLHNQAHFQCQAENRATITIHGSCTLSFGSQTITNAAVYRTDVANKKHALTVEVTATNIVYTKHGACVFLSPFGTGPHTGAQLNGSVTVAAADNSGNPVNLRATGTNNH